MVEIPTTVKNKDLVERRRKQIVLAAIKLFSRNGFHKTTLKELAEETGLSYGNIYDYVGSKEDIFFLIHDFLAGSAMEILNRSIEEIQDPIEKLRRMVRGEFNLMDQWADAVLLIYQESHILGENFLKQLLTKERAHLEKFERVLNEAIQAGQIRKCNVRLVSNLIKSMIDTWTIKRWDLRAHANQLEAENNIMEIITRGLLPSDAPCPAILRQVGALSGKIALVVNGETVLGQAVCNTLSAEGMKVVVYVDKRWRGRRVFNNRVGEAFYVPKFTFENEDPNLPEKIDEIEKRFGPIDIYVHDLGVGTIEKPGNGAGMIAGSQMEENLRQAQAFAGLFKKRMSGRATGRIVYMAPWAWDAHADRVRYEIVKAGTIALTHTLSRQLASRGINVNCIIPGYIRGVRPLKIEKSLGRDILERIPSGRLGEFFDVAETVLFSIRDESKYLTGQVFHVTGGN